MNNIPNQIQNTLNNHHIEKLKISAKYIKTKKQIKTTTEAVEMETEIAKTQT